MSNGIIPAAEACRQANYMAQQACAQLNFSFEEIKGVMKQEKAPDGLSLRDEFEDPNNQMDLDYGNVELNENAKIIQELMQNKEFRDRQGNLPDLDM